MPITHYDHGIILPKLTRKTTEKGRRYFTPEGNTYPSITTVLSELSKDSIKAWRKRVGEEEANKISARASKRGTKVHQICEDYLNNNKDYLKGVLPNNVASFNDIKPIIDANINNVWFQEEFLYSDHFKCAGQVDCIGEWAGELSIIDFKTSRKPKKEEWIQNYFMQCAFYAAAFFERTGIPIKQSVVLITVDGDAPQTFITKPHDYLKDLIKARKHYKSIYNV